VRLEGIIEVNLPALSATLQGKPQILGSDDGDAFTSFPPWGHQFEGVHRGVGQMNGLLEERCFF
jgi:hypothetical protein